MKSPDKPKPGVLIIGDKGELQMKLCWKVPGHLDDLVRALRDEHITKPQAVFEKAIALDFDQIMVITRTGRITMNGENTEPPANQPDHIRKAFGDNPDNPFGRGTQLFMDMSGEFDHVRKAEDRKRK